MKFFTLPTTLSVLIIPLMLAAGVFFAPEPASAQALGGFVSCSGTDCSFCQLVDMGNTMIGWLIGILFLVFAVVMVIAGFGMVTSAGNPSAVSDAKSKFVNACIGLLIVLGAWLLVDTIMRGLLKDGDGEVSGVAFWSEVECFTQRDFAFGEGEREALVYSSEITCSPIAQNCDSFVRDCELDGTVVESTISGGGRRVGCERPAGVLVGGGGGAGSVAGHAGSDGLGGSSGGSGGSRSSTGACDRSKMTTIPFLGGRVTVDKGVVRDLQSIDAEWRRRGGHSFYRVTSVAAYNCRNVRNSNRKSVHSYGLAVDINPAQNPYGSRLITDMPPAFISMFTSRGWGWGGNWRSVKDAMHYSMASREGGRIRIQ